MLRIRETINSYVPSDKRMKVANGQGDFGLVELGFGPSVFGELVISRADDAVLLPHLAEEGRAVSLAIEQQDKTMPVRIVVEFLLTRLSGHVFTRLIVETPQKVLRMKEFKAVAHPEIYLKDLMVTYRPPEEVFVAE